MDPTDPTVDRELDEGETRRALRVSTPLRTVIHSLKNEEGVTYSEWVEETIDKHDIDSLGLDGDEMPNLKITPSAYESVDEIAGESARMRDVLGYLAVLELADQGHLDEAAVLASEHPAPLWQAIEEVLFDEQQ